MSLCGKNSIWFSVSAFCYFMAPRLGLVGNWLIQAVIRVWECRSFIQDFMEENNVESVNVCPGSGIDRQT